jgi:hypothetical protein
MFGKVAIFGVNAQDFQRSVEGCHWQPSAAFGNLRDFPGNGREAAAPST